MSSKWWKTSLKETPARSATWLAVGRATHAFCEQRDQSFCDRAAGPGPACGPAVYGLTIRNSSRAGRHRGRLNSLHH